jgi:hypothetical protein
MGFFILLQQVMQYDPVPCKGCGAILNPLAFVDYASRVWTCCMCHTRNNFPSNYQGISPEVLPLSSYSTLANYQGISTEALHLLLSTLSSYSTLANASHFYLQLQ